MEGTQSLVGCVLFFVFSEKIPGPRATLFLNHRL